MGWDGEGVNGTGSWSSERECGVIVLIPLMYFFQSNISGLKGMPFQI